MIQFHNPNRSSPITAMNLSLYILLLHLLHRLTLSAATESPMMLPSAACTDELVVFSSCLPFIGGSPNNRTEFPPPECCDDVSAAFTDGSAICVCYLVLRPDMLGFPLNSSKLLSLTSFCPRDDQNSTANSLKALCSDSAHLPPLHSITGSNNPKPHNDAAGSPPPQESINSPSNVKPADEVPYQASSSTQKIYLLHLTALSSLLFHFHFSSKNS